MLMKNVFGWVVIAIVGVVVAVNSFFMLISPRAWLHLPKWLRAAPDSMTEAKYGSGLGAIQIRIVGAVFLALIIWVIYNSLLRSR
jgi:hypothetical protein